jgi:hypothetical protein
VTLVTWSASRGSLEAEAARLVFVWISCATSIGRPPVVPDVIELIVRLVRENPHWSRRRIAMELAKLGFRVDKNTVAKYMPKSGGRCRRPRQTWGTFLQSHLAGTLAIDFFTVPT